ncbi:hypothetical protein Fuma_06050 [Fuerstiella marisgermanici]|uniref:Uncharacterized protein n=1 Tax=Fuerstiella marisgermanici TaxID=1891926 RepID=A0A1P8WQP4_9PLAN|nr:hypothetical protein Fuma_06050 [Fuerstiella marisgermanici]
MNQGFIKLSPTDWSLERAGKEVRIVYCIRLGGRFKCSTTLNRVLFVRHQFTQSWRSDYCGEREQSKMLSIGVVLVAAFVWESAEFTAPASVEIRTAVERSIPHIEEQGVVWIEENNCVSCRRTCTMTQSLRWYRFQGHVNLLF